MRYDCHVDVAAAGHRRAGMRDGHHAVLVDTVGVGFELQLLHMRAPHAVPTRAVATIDGRTSWRQLQELHGHGVRAARLRLGGLRDAAPLLDCEMTAARLPADWHIELALPQAGTARMAGVLSRIGRAVVVEMDSCAVLGMTARQVAEIAWWLEMGNLYIKLLMACSTLAAPRGLPRPVRGLLEAFPDRFLWGRGAFDADVDTTLQARLDATARRVYRF